MKNNNWVVYLGVPVLLVLFTCTVVTVGYIMGQTTNPSPLKAEVTNAEHQLLVDATAASVREALRIAAIDVVASTAEEDLVNSAIHELAQVAIVSPLPHVAEALFWQHLVPKAPLPEPEASEGEGETPPIIEPPTGIVWGDLDSPMVVDFPDGGTWIFSIEDIPLGAQITITATGP